MNYKSKIQLAYRLVIDSNSTFVWDKYVFEDTYQEYLLQHQQFNSKENPKNTFRELLAENEDLSDNHLEAIGRVIRTLERLTRLNKSLLLISKIENRQYGELESVSVNALVKMLVVEFSDFAELKNITIALEESGRIEASMNKDLAAILVSNLLKNAIAHNINAGKISVRINSHSLIIANTGTLSPLNPLKIFKRFEKDSATQESTGLGLAIVKAIIDLYGYKLSYSFAHQQHQMIIDFK